MRHAIATLFASLLVNVICVTAKELPAIVTYTVSPAEVSVARNGDFTRAAAIDSDSLASTMIEANIQPTRTRSDAGRSRRTDDVTVATSFEREGGAGDAEENVKIVQNYAVTNFNNNLSTTRSTTESVIELLDRLRNLPPEESGGRLEALGSGTERAETNDDALQLLNEWREHVQVPMEAGQTKDTTISASREDATTTPSLLMDVSEPLTATQEPYITTEEPNNSGNNNDTFLKTSGVFTSHTTTTVVTTTNTTNVTTNVTTATVTTTTTTATATVTTTTNNDGLGHITSQEPITNDYTSSEEENIASSTDSMVIGTTRFDETTSNDMGEFSTTSLPTTSANNNDDILIPNVPLVAVGGGGIIKDSESAAADDDPDDKDDKDESGGGGAAFWDSRVEIAVVSAAAVLLCLVAAAALITYCVCRSHFHRKNIYTTMEVEPRPQFFTKPGPPVILRHEVEERRRVPQSHTPSFEERERQKVTEL